MVRLEVVDRASRIVVLQAEMDPEQFLNLLSNRTAYGPASWTNHTDRIGKVMQHESHALDGSVFKDQADATRACDDWATQNGWQYAEARRNNVGSWIFTGRRWVKPEPGQEPAGFTYDD